MKIDIKNYTPIEAADRNCCTRKTAKTSGDSAFCTTLGHRWNTDEALMSKREIW
jgi:hypothetical protein